MLGEQNGVKYRIRSDYRSDSLRLIVEFDGLPHYKDPAVIIKDDKTQKYTGKTDIRLCVILTNKFRRSGT